MGYCIGSLTPEGSTGLKMAQTVPCPIGLQEPGPALPGKHTAQQVAEGLPLAAWTQSLLWPPTTIAEFLLLKESSSRLPLAILPQKAKGLVSSYAWARQGRRKRFSVTIKAESFLTPYNSSPHPIKRRQCYKDIEQPRSIITLAAWWPLCLLLKNRTTGKQP